MPKAGYCEVCKKNVWLKEDGSCENGHPLNVVKGVYEASSESRKQKLKSPRKRGGRSMFELTPKCPYCGSTNISISETQATRASKKVLAGMVFLPLAFLAGRKPKEPAECFDCGRRWKVK